MNKFLSFIFVAMISSKMYAVEFEVNSKDECLDIPLITTVSELPTGQILFCIKYREITPFNSPIEINLCVRDPHGTPVFEGWLDPGLPSEKDIYSVVFYVDKRCLDNSSLVITSDWSKKRFLFSAARVIDSGLVEFKFNLKSLYEWNSQYGDDVELGRKRERGLMAQKDEGLINWRNGVLLEK